MIREVKEQTDATPEEIARVTGTSVSYARAIISEDVPDSSALRRAKKKSINRQKP